MSKLGHLRIQGYRRLVDINLEMRPMMVMIGANGVGKTSLLSAISALSASASGRLGATLSRLLSGSNPADHVIALTDVYTGTGDFADANDAKSKMTTWVGNETRFTPHVALYEFEAWLLPYWNQIKQLSGTKRNAPSVRPESVNHGKPPSKWISEAFATGTRGRSYVKTRDATRLLHDIDIAETINRCPELKALVNSILRLSGGVELQ